MQAEKVKPEITGIYPLNFIQQALLFHSLQEENLDQGFLQVQGDLEGKIDVEKFKRSWAQTIDRHESLRTSIHWEDIEKPLQVIHKKAENLPFDFYDWTQLSTKEQFEKLGQFKKADRARKLNLSKAPVLRVNLIKLAEDKHFLLWSCHHILADGWSASIILQDVFAFYGASVSEKQAELPAIPSYKTYLARIKEKDKSEAERFWKNEFKDFRKPFLIGGKTAGRVSDENAFQTLALKLSADKSDQLRKFAKENKITLNTLMQGIWALLLMRYAKSREITIGTTTSGRSLDLPQAEFMAGMFMNVLPFRAKFDDEENFADWLRSIQVRQAKIRNFEFVGLNELNDWSNGYKDGVLFDNLIIFENMPLGNLSGGGIELKNFKSGLTSNYAVTLAVNPSEEIELIFKYDSSKISADTAKRFIENLKKIPPENLPQAGELKTGSLFNLFAEFSADEAENLDAEDGQDSENYTAPGNDLELKLTGIWEKLLDRQPIGVRDDFFEIGGTSLQAIRLFNEIEKQFDRKIQPARLLHNRSIELLAKLIDGKDSDEKLSSLVPLRASGSKLPLFCLHAGGGHVFFYQQLAKNLDDDQPVYALQRLDQDDLTQSAQSIEAMAEKYLAEIRKVQPAGPYSVLGYCFSTSVGWEISRQIIEMGEEMGVVAMIDSPPFFTDKRATRNKVERIVNKVKKLDFSFIKTMYEGRVKHPLRQKIKNLQSDEEEKNKQKILVNLNKNAERYVWKALPVKVTLIRSSWLAVIPSQNEAVKEWDDLALNGVETSVIDSHHLTIFEEPQVKSLAEHLQKSLDKVQT